MKQYTIKEAVSFDGVALHSGNTVNMSIHPAPVNTGIIFHRTDIEMPDIPATYPYVSNTLLNTAISIGQNTILTIEHLMSALNACRIDNCVVKISNKEPAVMDGSAIEFMKVIKQAGVIEQDAYVKILKILKPVTVSDQNSTITIMPNEYRELEIFFSINFPNQIIGSQSLLYIHNSSNFEREISRARTFGFLEEFNNLREMGLALGGSLDNAIVVSNKSIENPDGLRYRDEFVRHKILDLVGDMSTSGTHVVFAKINANRSGHKLTNTLLHHVFSAKENYQWIYIDDNGNEQIIDA